jgi:hypothetical protein
MMICPANVPVIVELCPAALRATANNIGAHLVPSGCKTYVHLVSQAPHSDFIKCGCSQNKNRGIHKKARFKAIVESMKLYFKACLIPSIYRIFCLPRRSVGINCVASL